MNTRRTFIAGVASAAAAELAWARCGWIAAHPADRADGPDLGDWRRVDGTGTGAWGSHDPLQRTSQSSRLSHWRCRECDLPRYGRRGLPGRTSWAPRHPPELPTSRPAAGQQPSGHKH